MTAMPQSARLDAVRLDADEIAAIEQAAKRYLAPGSRVRLFGSRLDANRRGGDIVTAFVNQTWIKSKTENFVYNLS
jgi:hypothetical protein